MLSSHHFFLNHANQPDFSRILGVNVSGYLTAESGVGQAARGYVTALKICNQALTLLDFSAYVPTRREDNTLSNFSLDNHYSTNLVCINAEEIPYFISHIGSQYFKDKYNIGLWAWELPEFPTAWLDRFDYFDEIWVGSNFMYQSIAKKSPVRVVTVPHIVHIDLQVKYSKAYFGIPESEFVFLFMFSGFSILPRKNPLSVVEAFLKAFQPTEPIRLVLKCTNGENDPEYFRLLQHAIADARITLINEYLSRDETNGLLSVCDCYISLHRSEGFGLTLAEAMFLEKPVIATGWSGNMDFMTINNSYPVEYELTQLQQDYGHYKQGQVWAEPNIEHAAQLMRHVYEQPVEAKKKAQRAALDIRSTNSPQAVSQIVQARLDIIPQSLAKRAKIIQTQLELEHSQLEIQKTQVELEQSRLELQQTQVELEQSQATIRVIYTSKFWKLRKSWFKIKQALGLKIDE